MQSSGLRHRVRLVADRLVEPYVSRIESKIDALQRPMTSLDQQTGDALPVSDVPSDRFHITNHELRTLELQRLAGDYERVVSIGANGSWYFEWFRQAVGDVSEHIGVEAFEEKPQDLPDYVTWVPETADRMTSIETGSVDLVYAGQTTEHLWAHELTGFLLEAHRVLRDGGMLALDSPNRAVTEHLHWSHGGHTVELDEVEMTELLELAGFVVESTRGVWLCRSDDEIMALEQGIDDPATFVRRTVLGADRPHDCFVWWINARRGAAEPQPDALAARVSELFHRHWSTRVSRGFFPGVESPLEVGPGRFREVARTLPFPLHSGAWVCSIEVTNGSLDSITRLELAIDAPGDHRIHTFTLTDAERSGERLSWRFDQPYLLFALVLRLSLETTSGLAITAPIRVEPSRD